jgi:sugar/nucleoside kinase (ribokinase family)
MNPDYLLIGHIAHDETPKGPKLGGTVSYAGCAADALGVRVAIVTSARKDDVVLKELPQSAQIHLIEAPQSTIFVNIYENDKRRQYIRGRARAPLTLNDVPTEWSHAPIVHLGPLDDEVDPALARAFPGSLVAAGPQGWMRTWDAEGVVRPKRWEHADELLPILDATVFSEEDIHRDRALEAHYASLARLLVVTRAANGCTVYQKGASPFNVPAPQVPVVDATGAGDVFTGVFLVTMHRTGDVRRAAEAATQLASISVTRPGMSGIPTQDEIRAVLGDTTAG